MAYAAAEVGLRKEGVADICCILNMPPPVSTSNYGKFVGRRKVRLTGGPNGAISRLSEFYRNEIRKSVDPTATKSPTDKKVAAEKNAKCYCGCSVPLCEKS